ncbi:hypothetical protein B0J13DRAFT_607193 [Dactylonectria estremocensis]|uniref:NACHT domain-containing protein n=1 Tax=Dactylonectria estremocensis TaxID=1079267 RepID=A0A9P9EUN9_9HYPO|nr:hypothetical protein B0J13DRAFT_607193 [Dactylonectria estremocensis]
MDPISALSLASNIVQFIDFSSKLIKTAAEVRRSASGATGELDDVAAMGENLQLLLRGLRTPRVPASAPEDAQRLAALASKCGSVCMELETLVKKIKRKGSTSGAGGFRVAWRVMNQSGKLTSLEKRLDSYRSQILSHIVVMMSESQSATHGLIESLTTANETAAQETREELRQQRNEILSTIRAELKTFQSHSSSTPTSTLPQAVSGFRVTLDRLSVNQQASASPQRPLGNDKSEALEEIRTALNRMSAAIRTIDVEDRVLQWLWFPELHSREAAIVDAHQGTYRWLLCDEETESQPESDDTDPYSSVTTEELSVESLGRDGQHVDLQTVNQDPAATVEQGSSVTSEVEDETDLDYISQEDQKMREEEEDHAKQEKRLAFVEWLENGSGVFYISGKAGSGKSTLMKCLAENPLTLQRLNDWASQSQKDIILVKFYFWSSGTKLQRSIEGLYRGILWEMLRICPALIRDIFPDHCGNVWARERTNGQRHDMEPQLSQLEAALDLLVKNPKTLQKHRVCLFIDGLDEYSGDYWKLSKLLVRWCGSQDIKICASSRPYNEFQRIFASDATTWLKLHELTYHDMARVVEDEFNDDERFAEALQTSQEYEEFVKMIVQRADGVFLWVRLVIQTLLAAIGNSCSVAQLRQKLEAIPDDLGAVFQQMLDRIERSELTRVARTFLTMQDDPPNSKPSRWVYIQAVLDDVSDGSNLEALLLNGSTGPFMSEDDCISKCRVMSRRLVGRCQGLLEVVYTGNQFPYCHHVQFIHRTLRDFLQLPENMAQMRKLSGDFNPPRALALGILAMAKFIPLGESIICPPHEMGQSSPIRRPSHREFETYSVNQLVIILLELDVVSESNECPPLLAEVNSLTCMLMKFAAASGIDKFDFPRATFEFSTFQTWYWDLVHRTHLESAILCQAANFSANKLLKEKIAQNANLIGQEPHDLLLASSITDILNAVPWDSSLSRFLLEHKPLTNREGPAICVRNLHGDESRHHIPNPPWTTWTLLLFNISQSGPKWAKWETYQKTLNRANRSRYIEQYLSHGSDPSVCFVGYKINERNEEAVVDKSGPYYMDLATMMGLWEFEVTEKMSSFLDADSPRWRWRIGEWLGRLGQETGSSTGVIQPLNMDGLEGKEFLVLKVVPLRRIKDVSVSELQDSLEGIFERNRSVDVTILV